MKQASPYNAAITGCTFKLFEFIRVLPILRAENVDELIKDEVENNRLIQINSRKARQTFIREFKRRYDAVPKSFWDRFEEIDETSQKVGLFFAILKAYQLIFDFHFSVAIKKFRSIDKEINHGDIMMELNEIAANDEFVDSWTDNTKKRCASVYLTILKQTGLTIDGTLTPVRLNKEQAEWYFRNGEEWFLEALFMQPYEINDIKQQLI